ncbi:SOS response-associated peptidase [Halobium salinum]|uniref:SOS response-associated peptidase n=1 Tax=Halobium salinum TaxID=1364940 RepID=A0ABD5PDM1_9EURY|nr:SOS response-associated peptidase [Halobium salinum]
MCGRYTLFTPQAELEERFGATPERPLEPRYNCAPGQALPVITDDAPDTMQLFEWGLVPTWAETKSDAGFINARSETVREKRSFAEAFERRRCLVPADGFYEWTETDSGKQPYRVAFEDDRPFAMAGIWERWHPKARQSGLAEFGQGGADDPDPESTVVETFAVLTTEPNATVSGLHDRMAVVLAPDEEDAWLDADPDAAGALLDPYPDDAMHAYPVSTRVNSPRNDDPSLVEAVEA